MGRAAKWFEWWCCAKINFDEVDGWSVVFENTSIKDVNNRVAAQKIDRRYNENIKLCHRREILYYININRCKSEHFVTHILTYNVLRYVKVCKRKCAYLSESHASTPNADEMNSNTPTILGCLLSNLGHHTLRQPYTKHTCILRSVVSHAKAAANTRVAASRATLHA